ncbi:type II secretion system GspH family protein [Oligoflexia bacterium]|nr:type II secretion system GspH family protein [Oligoflexia bacterium]
MNSKFSICDQNSISTESGFTLLEMIVAITIFLFFISMAVPRLATLNSTFNRVNARAWLLQDLKRAQANTVTEGCRGIFTIEPGAKSYWYGCDYLAYDVTANPEGDAMSFRRVLPDKITVTASDVVVFNSRGQTVDIFGIVSSVTFSLSESSEAFAVGSLNGTGVFAYN